MSPNIDPTTQTIPEMLRELADAIDAWAGEDMPRGDRAELRLRARELRIVALRIDRLMGNAAA